MKTKFVVNDEAVQEIRLSLTAYAGDAATIMLHEPSGRIIPLVGVVEQDGQVVVVRWCAEKSQYIKTDGEGRIYDRFGAK